MGIINLIKDIGRPVLSDRTILKYMKKGLLFENGLYKEQFQPNSVDLTLSGNCKYLNINHEGLDVFKQTTTEWYVDPMRPMNYSEDKFAPMHTDNGIKMGCVIHPGEFILMASREILNIPNGIIAFVQGRSSIARLGIQTEQAGLIDAGFRGTITFEVYNQSNHQIILYEGMRIAQVYFFKAQHAASLYGSKNKFSKYQNQIEATGSMINQDPEFRR